MTSTEPTTPLELRKFGLLVGGVFIGLFGLLLPWLKSHPMHLWPFCVGVPLVLLGLFFPVALRPLHSVWIKIGSVLGWINTRILLSLLFVFIFTPIGWIMRFLKKDPLELSWKQDAPTYWAEIGSSTPQPMDRPF